MQRYESYKPSGIPWVEELPSHWGSEKGKWIHQFKKDLNLRKKCDNVLSLTLRGVVNNDPDAPEGMVPKDYSTYQIFDKNDLVFKLIDLENFKTSRVGLVHERGIMSSAYLRVSLGAEHSARYYYYYYFSLYQQGIYNKLGAGVRSTLGSTDLLELGIPIPPRAEQDRIVTFLDQKTAEIDTTIAKKERLIELLQEQKSILINQAVTRGLNPDVPMRDSGYKWIGNIPSHWTLRRFKFCVSITSGQVDPRKEPFASMPLIAPNHIESGTGKLLKIETANDQGADSGKYLLESGDLLYSKIRPALRKACISPVSGLCSADMYVFRPKAIVDKYYLMGFILTDAFTLPALDAALRVAMPKVNRESLGDFPLMLPPIVEQKEIAKFMLDCEARFNPIIGAVKDEIDKLCELKSLIIANVTSGKIKV